MFRVYVQVWGIFISLALTLHSRAASIGRCIVNTTQALCPTFVLQLQRNKLLQSWELYQTWDGMSGMVSLAMRLGEVLLLHAIPTKYA